MFFNNRGLHLHCRFVIITENCNSFVCVPCMCRIDVRDVLNQLVEKALACKSCLREIVILASANVEEDISIISEKLTLAIKA